MAEEKKFNVKVISRDYYLPAKSSKESTLEALRAKIHNVLQPANGQFDRNIFCLDERGLQVISTNQEYNAFLSDKQKQVIYFTQKFVQSNKQSSFSIQPPFQKIKALIFGQKKFDKKEEDELQKKTLEDFLQIADQELKTDEQRENFINDLNNKYSVEVSEKHSSFGIQVDQEFNNKIKKYTESNPRKIVSDEDPFINIMLSYYEEYLQQNKVADKEQKLKDFWRFANWKADNTEYSQKTTGSVKEQKVAEIKLPDLIIAQGEEQSKQIKNIQKFNYFYNELIKLAKNSQTQEQFNKEADNIRSKVQTRGKKRNYGDEDWFSFVESFVSLFFIRIIKQKKFTYYPPQNDNDGVLPEIKDKDIVAVIGDWGTGMRDSIDLVQELVVNQNATIVIHLGDTYYTGNAKEHQRTTKLLNQLREKIKPKGKSFRFYLVPGNHDYYFGGKQFYDEFPKWNEKETDKQKFSFFCLRNKENYQIIGMDSGRHGANINIKVSTLFGQYDATKFEQEEVKWAKKKILQFPGQTILITHHQPFSPFEQISKDQKVNKKNKHINNLISEQLFDVLPKISCWVWGHEHRFTIYKPNVYGIPLCRLVGNSAWQNNKSESYDLKFEPKQITDKASFPKADENGYFWLTGMTIQPQKQNLKLEYIHMLSSYDKPSKRVGQKISEVIRKPSQQPIMANSIYYIKDASGLSYSLDKQNQIEINSVPTKFVFMKADDPKYEGEIKENMEIYIQCPQSYKYKNVSFYNSKIFRSYFYLRLTEEKSKFYFRKFGNQEGKSSETLRIGDTLSLYDQTNRQYGRIFREKDLLEFNVKWNYQPVSNSSGKVDKIEYLGVQIYNLPYKGSNIVSSTSLEFKNQMAGKGEKKQEGKKQVIDQTCKIF